MVNGRRGAPTPHAAGRVVGVCAAALGYAPTPSTVLLATPGKLLLATRRLVLVSG